MKKIITLLILFFSLSSFNLHRDKWDTYRENWSPLMKAIYEGDTTEFSRLIQKNKRITFATPKKGREKGITALDVAILKQNVIAVEMLLKTKKFLKLNEYLMTACGEDDVKIIELLFDYGADPNYITESTGNTPIIEATDFGSNEVLIALLQKSKNINTQIKGPGFTALMGAAIHLNVEKAKILLEYKADKTLTDSSGKTAYSYINEDLDIVNKDAVIKELKELLRND